MGTIRIGKVTVSGPPQTQFWLEADWVSQSQSGNYSVLGVWMVAANGPSSNSSAHFDGWGRQYAYTPDIDFDDYQAEPFLPSGYSANQIRWNRYSEHVFYHDAGGYGASVDFSMRVYGFADVHEYGSIEAPPRILKPPTAPRNLTVQNLSATNAGVMYDPPANLNGSTLTGYTAKWYEYVSIFNQQLRWTDTQSNGYTSPENGVLGPALKPNTRYIVSIYANSSAGNGAPALISLTTLPTSAPGISIATSESGEQATVTLTPPSGVSGVTEYNIEYRRPSDTTAMTTSTTSATKVISGLIPGAVYQYRANAEIGAYTSPWSTWVFGAQSAPNWNPGDYFDGSTTPKPDITYAWDGATSNSTSRALGKQPLGWLGFQDGAIDSGGTGSVARVTGGLFGGSAARVTFFSDATSHGFIMGIDGEVGGAVIQPATQYVGSIYVQLPGRSKQLEPGIAWFDSARTLIGYSWGVQVDVPSNPGDWQRLIVSAQSPSGAMYAAVVVHDTDAPDSPFLSGDIVLLDGAMVTLGQEFIYFDGSTADVPGYDYQWVGSPHDSASTRVLAPLSISDPLADPDCAPMPTAPRPPVVPADCIMEVSVWRRYALQIPDSAINNWRVALPTIMLTTGEAPERQVRIRTFPNPDNLPIEAINTGYGWEAEQILTYIPPHTTITIDAVARRAWASVNGGDPIPSDHLLYGTDGAPATWPELSCGYGYYIALDVPLEAPSGNLQPALQLTQRM